MEKEKENPKNHHRKPYAAGRGFCVRFYSAFQEIDGLVRTRFACLDLDLLKSKTKPQMHSINATDQRFELSE